MPSDRKIKNKTFFFFIFKLTFWMMELRFLCFTVLFFFQHHKALSLHLTPNSWIIAGSRSWGVKKGPGWAVLVLSDFNQ